MIESLFLVVFVMNTFRSEKYFLNIWFLSLLGKNQHSNSKEIILDKRTAVFKCWCFVVTKFTSWSFVVFYQSLETESLSFTSVDYFEFILLVLELVVSALTSFQNRQRTTVVYIDISFTKYMYWYFITNHLVLNEP